ncbi:MAG: hypothetical protein ABIB04_00160 [Patescibacteria group bacterium]
MKWPPKKQKNRRNTQKQRPRSRYIRRSLERGHRNEMLVYRAIITLKDKPAWFISCRFATEKEDRGGIDLVIATNDAGELFIQVKSSTEMAQAFRIEQSAFKPDWPLAIVVPLKNEGLQHLQKRTFAILDKLHNDLLIKYGKRLRGSDIRLP